MPDLGHRDASAVRDLIEHVIKKLRRTYAPPQVKRDAHPKLHGCVQAELIVGELDEAYRHGLFKRPGRYRTWVRFSNAFDIQHDLKAEPRGLALKVLEVTGGEHLDAGDGEQTTQDFLLATHDAFFLAGPGDYAGFAPAVERGTLAVVWYFASKITRWRGGVALWKSGRVMARNPLAIPYFSQTPYQLGPHTVKLQATPTLTPALMRSMPGAAGFKLKTMLFGLMLALSRVRAVQLLAQLAGRSLTPSSVTASGDRIASRDLLRHALMAFLASHDAEFELRVQRYVDERTTPLEDATRRWKMAPFTTVARLRIPRQVFWPVSGMPKDVVKATALMMDLGENMSFNPWHGLTAHTPLGAINQARRRIYPAIVRFRRDQNGVRDDDVLRLQDARSYEELRVIVQGISVWPPGSAPAPGAGDVSVYPVPPEFGYAPRAQNT
jgi:hypothetical protein